MTCHQLSPGGHITCSNPAPHGSGHVWLSDYVPDGHHDDEAVDW